MGDNIEPLITDLKESLDREIADLKESLHGLKQTVVTRFDTQAARLDRQAGLMQTGNRWISRLND